MQLTREIAEASASLALQNVCIEYPYKLDQLLTAPVDLSLPAALHPVFWGSYDWHSCVHMHWTLARLLHRMPKLPQAAAIVAHFDRRFTPDGIAGELATIGKRHYRSFERPYGWGWLLKLAAEFTALAQYDPRAERWRDALAPLAQAIAERFLTFLPRADYPTRAGTHGNSAFALLLALDWCEQVEHPALMHLIRERAHRWYSQDRRYPADYEPGGDDFMAGGLVEALLMQRVVDDCSYVDWWQQFEPSPTALANWLTAVRVADPADPKIVHLHGVNLTRAWCWRRLLPTLPPLLQPQVEAAIVSQLAASVPAGASGDYVGTHWLASYVVLALTDGAQSPVAGSPR